jgi:hypothetical protein
MNWWKKAERKNVEREKYRKQEYEVMMKMLDWSWGWRRWLTLIWSKGKNVENKNEGVGRGTRVSVRARKVSPSIYFHFQHFYRSTYVPFWFATFIFSRFLPFEIFTFDQSRENRMRFVLEYTLVFSISIHLHLYYFYFRYFSFLPFPIISRKWSGE